MKKNLTKLFTIGSVSIFVLAILISNLHSHSAGMTGLTFKTGGQGCYCHSSTPSSSVTVTFLNADSVAAGQTKSIRIKIQGGPGIAGGFDFAVKNGTLNVGSDAGVQKIGTELTHVSPKPFSADTVSWTFNYTAPNSSGWDTLYACGNSVNLNGQSTGDQWNFRVRFPVKIYQAAGITNITSNVTSFSLSQNYPNPFNPVTNINFSIPKEGFVSMKIFDLAGKEIITLVNKRLKTGEYKVDLNASELSSGVYIYRLSTEGYSETKKMMLVK